MSGLSRRRLLGGAAALALLPRAGPAAASGAITVAYQALPAAQTGLPSLHRLGYARLEKLANDVRRSIVPGVSAALDLPDMASRTAIAPGGYRLRSDPSLTTSFAADAHGGAAARRFAAAVGYVLRQDAVLVFAEEARGDSLAVTLRFEDAAPSAPLAHRFFRHAASVAAGLGGGYTTVGGALIFINLRDASGAPFSGLDDEEFAAALNEAASTFANSVRLVGTKRVRSELVAAAWGDSAGSQYVAILATLPPAALAQLDLLGFVFADMARNRAF